ncbi:TetR/AcrR family transcriptional regulator [Microbacterium sp. B2969]|uniref:TetR/AcrR family transcriptional regulator n=1 Tax=Microbacterium alkaliflavum TaxID=3248839 RepID=A0ABW7QCN7_9MICO
MSIERAPSARAGKARLDRETILAAALELAATPGVSAISFRELGARLGVDPTAVYRHFRSKDELMKALLDHITAVGLAEIEVPAEDWRGRLRELAMMTLRQFGRYPAIGVEAVVLTTNGPGEHTAIEMTLDAFARAGLEGDDLVRHYALLAGHVLSTSANIARARAERGGEWDGMWLGEAILADPREFPLIAAHSALLAEVRDEETYLAGVDMILDSAERTAAARG